MEVRRVVMLGNSSALLVRPPGEGEPFPKLLELVLNERAGDEVWIVENLAEVAGTIDDVERFLGRIVSLQPDVIVMKYGRVEAVRRPQSRRLWRWTYMRRPGLSRLRRTWRHRVLRPYSDLRRLLRLRRPWTPLPRFRRTLDDVLEYLCRETSAAILLVEANPIGRRIEEYGPGSLAALERYNDAVRELARKHGAEYVSLEELYRHDPELRDIDALLPDGTHLSARAHAALAQVLWERIAAVRSAREPIV